MPMSNPALKEEMQKRKDPLAPVGPNQLDKNKQTVKKDMLSPEDKDRLMDDAAEAAEVDAEEKFFELSPELQEKSNAATQQFAGEPGASPLKGMQALVESGDLSPEEQKEAQEYINKYEAFNKAAATSPDAVRELLKSKGINVEDLANKRFEENVRFFKEDLKNIRRK